MILTTNKLEKLSAFLLLFSKKKWNNLFGVLGKKLKSAFSCFFYGRQHNNKIEY